MAHYHLIPKWIFNKLQEIGIYYIHYINTSGVSSKSDIVNFKCVD